MKFAKVFMVVSLLLSATTVFATDPSNVAPGSGTAALTSPQLTAYVKIKVGDDAAAVTAILDSLTKGSKTAVTKTPIDKNSEIWTWKVSNSPANWNDEALKAPTSANETRFEVVLKDGKVVALLYSYASVTKTSAKNENVTEKEKEILKASTGSSFTETRIKGDKTFLKEQGL
ncbi:MAG: hypothetical protein Q7S36_00270 [Candidatus Liptonbacteria bacterium]|nr:hypothetical protein [Candidatus Liptonbacteria bacterium]